MNSYPFNSGIQLHTTVLSQALNALHAFADKHPDLHPWIVSPITTTVHFPSTAADQLRDTFGPEGWVIDGRVCYRMEGPVRVELSLPQTVSNPQPFTL